MIPECTLIAYVHAKPERRAELLKILEDFVAPTRSEAGCLDYHLHVSSDNPDLFILYENWRTRQALDEHLAKPYLADFWAKRHDYLSKEVEMTFLTMLSSHE